MPEIIEFYTGRAPILQNVPTYNCRKPTTSTTCSSNLAEAGRQGGARLGRLRHAGRADGLEGGDRRRSAPSSKAQPDNYIAQPTLALSTCPTLVEAGVAPRHLDLRPFVLFGDRVRLAPGGLTRVALKPGSLVVNSSQGGGTKDTWVLQD